MEGFLIGVLDHKYHIGITFELSILGNGSKNMNHFFI